MAKSKGEGFDRAAAVTCSLLGYGVLAGMIYLAVGLILALTREGFDLGRHPLSVLMLGEGGWMQRANLIVTGAMVVVAAVGFGRVLRGSAGSAARAATLVLVYGVCLVASGIFAPDPVAGFPPGAIGGEASAGGILHLAFGAVGFVSLAAAAFLLAGWYAVEGSPGRATFSRAAGAVIGLGFVGGAALATTAAGVALLWGAVVAGWVWLAVASVDLYRAVPHPDAHRRQAV